MQRNRLFLAATGHSLARAEMIGGKWMVSHALEAMKINCLVRHPVDVNMLYLGTGENGVLLSKDGGKSWFEMGLKKTPVMSLAIDPSNPEMIYAGSKPVSVYQTKDGGASWVELESMRKTRKWWWFSPADPPGMLPYVNALAVSPKDPNVILAGIELGAVMRTEDGGRTWSKHLRGADRDCHSLKFHSSDGDWAYEGGGMGGSAFSKDGGRTWQKPKQGLGRKYGWMVASDPAEPEIWYLSASDQPNLLRGEFNPPAHQDGQAKAHIYRKFGDHPWEQLSGGLPDPMDYMAYALVTIPGEAGVLFAGLTNGEVWVTENYGDHWVKMPFNLGGVHGPMIVI